MSKVPQSPRPGNPASRSYDSGSWIDLIAFLAILAFGGILLVYGQVTAGSLATICATLGGLYAGWKRLRSSGEDPPAGRVDEEKGEQVGEEPSQRLR